MATNPNIPNATEAAPTANEDPFEKHINIAIEAQDGKPDESTTQTPNAETPSGTEAGKTGEPAKSGDKKDSTSGGGDRTAQQQPDKKGQEEKKPTAGAKDLTLADGTVVRGGPERRFYEQREVARQEANHWKTQATTLQRERDEAIRERDTIRQSVESVQGVPPDHVRIGVNIVRDLQSDPVGTMKKLLAEVLAQGHSVESIGAGVDQLARQRVIDAYLAQNPQQQQTSEADIAREAQETATRFYTNHPDARPHDALLARMMGDHPELELESAYFQLKNEFIARGYDWSLSLEENLKQSASPESNSTQQQPAPKAPLPNGRNIDTTTTHSADEVRIAHEDSDMGDIVKQAMREAGMNV
jgi:hypothetical protein